MARAHKSHEDNNKYVATKSPEFRVLSISYYTNILQSPVAAQLAASYAYLATFANCAAKRTCTPLVSTECLRGPYSSIRHSSRTLGATQLLSTHNYTHKHTFPFPDIGGSSRTTLSGGLSSAGTHPLSGTPDSSGPIPVIMVAQLGALTDGIWSLARVVTAPSW